MEIVLLVAGAVLGVIFDRLTRIGHRRVVQNRENAIRAKALEGSEAHAVTRWLLSYYDDAELFQCSISGESSVIPFFADSRWIYSIPLDQAERVLKEHPVEESVERFQVNKHLIALREAQGQRLFNNLTYYTQEIISDNGALPMIAIAPTEYYKVITNLISLEEEVFHAVRSGTARAPVRDKYLPNQLIVGQQAMRPLSFGVNVGFVLRSDVSLKILIQTRSKLTVTYGGSKALFPSFGLAPIGSANLRADRLLHVNLIKEYLEEFYGYDDLIDSLSQRRADPMWFMELPEAVALERARNDGSLKLHVLGFGVDCLNCLVWLLTSSPCF